MPMKTTIKKVSPDDITNIVELAKVIWIEHYEPIISRAQIDYMLAQFQSISAISQQISQGYEYFKVVENEQILGYFSIQDRAEKSLFISKFYLHKKARGQGIGKKMLSFINDLAKERDCETLDLTVNKKNPAYKIYLSLGFVNQAKAQFDIGGGFIMDDFLLSKNYSALLFISSILINQFNRNTTINIF